VNGQVVEAEDELIETTPGGSREEFEWNQYYLGK
jgi:hypothetical protein